MASLPGRLVHQEPAAHPPWTQKLAEQTEMDVFNLGDVGFGPQDELKMLQQYGLKKQPQWVIMAYFGE